VFAVIFTAQINRQDQAYKEMATQMRERAYELYGCKGFTAVTEGDREIAISYWEYEDQIRAWKKDIEHITAQQLGQTQWYQSYKVEVVKIVREYGTLLTHSK